MVKTKTRKISKRVLKMINDPETVWGKNPDLELFWNNLASGKNVILIYKDKSHEYINLPNRKTKKYEVLMNDFDSNSNVIAILSSNMSQDAYEQYLYPRAKNKTVNFVIKNYKKYFKPITENSKLRVPL